MSILKLIVALMMAVLSYAVEMSHEVLTPKQKAVAKKHPKASKKLALQKNKLLAACKKHPKDCRALVKFISKNPAYLKKQFAAVKKTYKGKIPK